MNIKCSNGQKYHVDLDTSKSVLEFKQQLEQITGIPVDKQRLIVAGRVLKDSQPIAEYSTSRAIPRESLDRTRALTWLVIVVVA